MLVMFSRVKTTQQKGKLISGDVVGSVDRMNLERREVVEIALFSCSSLLLLSSSPLSSPPLLSSSPFPSLYPSELPDYPK